MPAESGRASDAARRDEFHIKPLVAGARRTRSCSPPPARLEAGADAGAAVVRGVVGARAHRRRWQLAAGGPTVAESDLFAEVEAPAFAEPATLEDESEP